MAYTIKTVANLGKWFTKNGFECEIVLGDDFAFEPDDETIVIPATYDDGPDKYFIEFLRNLGLCGCVTVPAMSVLHELGHFITCPNCSDEEWERSVAECGRIAETIKDEREMLFAYWRTSVELAANIWAVDFANSNHKAVAELMAIMI